MIDVVYKLGIGSRFEDKELRYSLRSLSNFKDLGKVFIIGHKPNWINYEKLIHISCHDSYLSNKDANLINKLILACCDSRLSENFLNFSDDQVILKKIDKAYFQTPKYDNNHLSNVLNQNRKLNRWQQRLKKTVDILRQRNYLYNCYEAHLPYLLNKHKYPEVLFRYDYGFDKGYVGNTLYFNTIKANGSNVREIDLCRLEKKYTESQIEILCKGKIILNYTEAATNEDLFMFLRKNFYDKSIYEI